MVFVWRWLIVFREFPEEQSHLFMGFYDQFIGSINDLVFGKMRQKKQAFRYLFKLGIGWLIGMGMAVLALSSLFESHIYMISSLFIGLSQVLFR